TWNRFSIPAFAPTFLNISMIGFALFAAPYFNPPVLALAWAVTTFDHLDDMHQAFLQQNFDLPPGSVPCHIVNSSEAFVQLARQGT
ncbi:hypothetical protein ONK27_26635, partial [Salmonella enterica subsp. enterica serovar Virginia]|nr:hypothetical protein [Salmonella enterica subsp. enterica serovar Virginia]